MRAFFLEEEPHKIAKMNNPAPPSYEDFELTEERFHIIKHQASFKDASEIAFFSCAPFSLLLALLTFIENDFFTAFIVFLIAHLIFASIIEFIIENLTLGAYLESKAMRTIKDTTLLTNNTYLIKNNMMRSKRYCRGKPKKENVKKDEELIGKNFHTGCLLIHMSLKEKLQTYLETKDIRLM